MSFWGKFQNKCLMTSVMDLYLAHEILSGFMVQNPCIDKSFDPLGAFFSHKSLLPAVYHYNKILVLDFQKLTSPETIQKWGQRSSLFLSYSCNIPVIAKKIRVVTHQLSYISSSVFSMRKSCFFAFRCF